MSTAKPSCCHYGWVIVATALLGIFAGLGLGRFSLGMLLPAMRVALQLSYAQVGLIGTANFCGYLVAVLLVRFLAKRIKPRGLIVAALVLIGVTMLAIARTTNFPLLIGLYTLTGMGSGVVNVMLMALIPIWFSRSKRGLATGIIVSGSGLAILISGKFAPWVNRQYGAEGWRYNWFFLGVGVLVVALLALLTIRNHPAEKNLEPYGYRPASEPTGPTLAKSCPRSTLIHLAGLYFLFGYSYVIFVTFMATALIQEMGYSEAAAGSLWSVVGGLSLFSGPLFGSVSDKFGRKTGFMAVFSLQTVAYLCMAQSSPGLLLYIAVFAFGICAWSIPSLMGATVSDFVGAQNTASVFGFVTFVFGLGQIAGPAVAGKITDLTHSFSGSFTMAAATTALAILLSWKLPKA